MPSSRSATPSTRERVDQRRRRYASFAPARAAVAREYLIGRFSLNPQMTGLIALRVDATGSPNNGAWDGVALAVYLEKRTLQ